MTGNRNIQNVGEPDSLSGECNGDGLSFIYPIEASEKPYMYPVEYVAYKRKTAMPDSITGRYMRAYPLGCLYAMNVSAETAAMTIAGIMVSRMMPNRSSAKRGFGLIREARTLLSCSCR